MVTRAAQRHKRRKDGRHAGSGRHARLSPFHHGQPFLKGGDRRIGKARIDVTDFLTGKTRRGLRRAIENVT